jgi:hypothetical protein
MMDEMILECYVNTKLFSRLTTSHCRVTSFDLLCNFSISPLVITTSSKFEFFFHPLVFAVFYVFNQKSGSAADDK